MGGAVEVLPDVSGIDRSFHYLSDGGVAEGTIVRVRLNGRRVRGWVVAVDRPPPPEVALQPLLERVSCGPPAAVVELCRWASWRFCGPLRPMLKAASPERIVRQLATDRPAWPRRPGEGPAAAAVADALEKGGGIVRLPPAEERLPAVEAALSRLGEGDGALVLVEARDDAVRLVALLRRRGWPVALYPDEWEAASSGRVVVGARNAAFAPGPFRLFLVLDAQSDWYRSERTPNVDARAVVAERARREAAPALFFTPCPTVELVAESGPVVITLPSAHERVGWGSIAVLDQREEDPAEGGYPSSLVGWIRRAASEDGRPVVCILNRTGRARLLSCPSCRETQRCESCGAAVVQEALAPAGALATLSCPRCQTTRPALCSACGSGRLRVMRPGVSRAREQLQAVTGLEVGELSGRGEVPATPVIMATQAALSRLRTASLVAWLEFDQELLAPRFRAAEEALSLLARSVRLVTRRQRGRVVVRTSIPEHEVVRAAAEGDPELVLAAERRKREQLRLPPCSALALLSGAGAHELAGRLSGLELAPAPGDEVVVRAPGHGELADVLGRLADEGGGWTAWGVRVELDPLSL